jgi:UDP-hydrolysing UDP-N-acetyl-D-glucosamine 2-epimerase
MTETNKRRKVCVVITARPSYSRVRSALLALRDRPDVELQVVVAASALLERFGNVSKIIEQDGFKISARAFTIVEGETLVTSAKSMGLGVVELASIFDMLAPDVVVTIADRYETLATAVAASYINVPVAHLQGGEVTGSIDEKVRHAVTKLSNLHFASTKLAADWIVRLGEPRDSVFFTGCPSIDIAADILRDPTAATFNPFKNYGGVGPTFALDDGFIIVMQHPVTTEFGEAADQIVETLHAVIKLDVNAFWFWPNIDAGSDMVSKMIRTYREEGRMKRVHFFRNLLPDDFLKLMLRSRCIVGNSSVSLREGSFLGVPAVNIGTRQQFRERGVNVMDVGYDAEKIGTAIEVQYQKGRCPSDSLYGDGQAGARIAQHLASEALRSDKVLTYAYDQ